MSRLTRTSLMLAFFIGLDKCLALLRQVIIARQFGLSSELDAFNVANNLPDLLFALISGGALAVAFIPVLTEVLTKNGRRPAWELFSRIANLAFILTACFAILIALLADPLVRWKVGIAPGFNQAQQGLVTELMRLNLVATLIFSISGLVMAGLQANQHFLFPAMAPPLYNLGQIFGALVLAPEKGYTLAGFTLPAFGMGVYGLVVGVIIGALLHLSIQIPGLIRYGFRWSSSLGLNDVVVQKVIRLFGPRLLTMFIIQLIFIVRDNLASRLQPGSVSALTYGWMIMQVPETLIGTALGIAILPTLSELAAREDWDAFRSTIERAVRVLLAITIPLSVVMMIGLRPILAVVFRFDEQGTDLLLWSTRGYLLGVTGQSLLEVVNRSFYARQKVYVPLIGAILNVTIYISLGALLFRPMGAPGISLTDSIAFTTQAVVLMFILNRKMPSKVTAGWTIARAFLAAGVGAGSAFFVLTMLSVRVSPIIAGGSSMIVGGLVTIPFIWKEMRLLLRL
jgi:putative peptidoglycan lipid II flippase